MVSVVKSATGLTGRYANALFELAKEQDVLDIVAKDLKSLSELISMHDELKRLVLSPILSRSEQGSAIAVILSRIGASDLTVRFIGVTSANRRLFALGKIIDDYLSILAQHRGEVAAEVLSATPLTKKQLSQLSDVLRRSVGGAVALKSNVDPQLLGGLVIRVGSIMIDSSLNNKLQRLRLAMIGVG